MRSPVVWFTLYCFVATQTAAHAQSDPHAEGVAAGKAANPIARAGVTAASASAVVPGYTTTPAEAVYYRQPDLASQGSGRLSLCATMPDDPVCQAQRGALRSANTPRPAVGATDPSIAAAEGIARRPSSVLENIATYYSGCTTATKTIPAGVQTRSCLRYDSIGNCACSRTLSVGVTRTANCAPGDWFAHASSGGTGLDVQCAPDRPDTQHFRVTQHGAMLASFDLDVATPIAFPRMVAVLGKEYSFVTGAEIRTGLWVADTSCSGDTCRLTAMVAAERVDYCTGSIDSPDYACFSIEPFLERYAACGVGTQSGDNIQDTLCQGEGECKTTTLDRAKCYAPAGGWTPYSGIDVTGTVPGNYWNIDRDRAVVGWEPNANYGPIPTLHLSYARPSTRATTADRWDDQCPNLAGTGRCAADAPAVCVDGPSTKVIDGVSVTRECWEYRTTLSCTAGSPVDQCAPLRAGGCKRSGSACRQSNPTTGLCEVFEDSYACQVEAHTETSAGNCPSNVFCLQGNCFDIARSNDGDFARSMSMLEAAREAGVYLDTDRMQVFKGEDNRCRDRLLKNCCHADGAGAGMTNQSLFGTGSRLVYDVLMNAENQQFVSQGMSALLLGGGFDGTFTSYGVAVAVNGTALPTGSVAVFAGDGIVVAFDPWSLAISVVIYIAMSMMSCNEDEGKLAMKEGAQLCHTVGTRCSSCVRIFGHCVSCIEHTTSKCCFNSMLARIVQEQGRAQIGKGWGSAERPDCSGFTVAELQSLDFSAMDLSAFYASLVPTLPDLGSLQRGNASRVPACYYGQGKC